MKYFKIYIFKHFLCFMIFQWFLNINKLNEFSKITFHYFICFDEIFIFFAWWKRKFRHSSGRFFIKYYFTKLFFYEFTKTLSAHFKMLHHLNIPEKKKKILISVILRNWFFKISQKIRDNINLTSITHIHYLLFA